VTAKTQSRHGLRALKGRLLVRGLNAIDQRSAAAKALSAWRVGILASLGGESNLSAMELTLVEQACRNRLILDSVDAWLLSQPSLVNRKRKTLLPVIAQRMQIDAALTRTLTTLGLNRREKEINLHEYLDSPEHKAAVAAAREEELAYARADESAPEPSNDASNAPAGTATPAATISDEGEQS
jgi:hypothetical protein